MTETDTSKRRDYLDSVIVQHGIASMPVDKFNALSAERDAAIERAEKAEEIAEGLRARVAQAERDEIAYEPYPGAFDGILGKDERED